MQTQSNSGKLSLTKTIKESYKTITKPLLNVKSTFIALCADIDRYIRLSIGREVRKNMKGTDILKLKSLYPRLSELSVESWNKLKAMFVRIRDNNAHLYQNKAVCIDRDLLAYLISLVEPEMDAVQKGNELTVYGSYYVLMFLAQKYQLHSFVPLLMRAQNFSDMSAKEINTFAVNSLHRFRDFCGIGKPIDINGDRCPNEIVIINDTLRRNLASIFLGLEAVVGDRSTAIYYTPSFRGILKRAEGIDGELFEQIVELRNICFHGHWFGDEVAFLDGGKKVFDLYETIETLRMLRDALIGDKRFDSVTKTVERIVNVSRLKTL